MKRSPLRAPDLVIIAYESIVAALVLAFWGKLDHPALYLALNLGLIGVTVALAILEARRPSRLTTFLHSWWPVVAVPVSFKAIAWISPGVHPFADGAWDWRLQALDEWLFGDTGAFFRSIAWGPAADLLSIGYWSYFFQPIVLGAALYFRGDLRKFREATTVLLVGWFISYLGYYALPAVGPHLVVDGPRAPELEGWLWAGPLHRLLLTLEGTIPDAFPSGHALVAMLVLVLSWRLHRRVFWWIFPFAAGLVLATMYLRYHYIVDVLASVLLLPGCVALGRAIHRWNEPERVETPAPLWQNSELSHYEEKT